MAPLFSAITLFNGSPIVFLHEFHRCLVILAASEVLIRILETIEPTVLPAFAEDTLLTNVEYLLWPHEEE